MAWEIHPGSGAAPSPDKDASTEHQMQIVVRRSAGPGHLAANNSRQPGELPGHDSRNTVQSQFVGMALNAVHTEHVQ